MLGYSSSKLDGHKRLSLRRWLPSPHPARSREKPRPIIEGELIISLYSRAYTPIRRQSVDAVYQGCDSLDALVSTDLIDRTERQKINWTNSIAFGLFHGGALAALFMFSWRACAVAVFLHWMSAGLGISMGYHRLHTHRSYQVPLALEYFFAVCGTLTLQGGPIFWVATHRIHHQKSDQPGDPHSPRDGGWWAHIGWLLVGE